MLLSIFSGVFIWRLTRSECPKACQAVSHARWRYLRDALDND
jgi:hypothetical protein